MKHFICTVGIILLVAGSAWAESEDAVRVERLAKSTASWNGSPLPAYPEGTPEVTILRIHILPGAALPLHEHPVINAGVLLTGELTVTTQDGETLHLTAGDPIVEVVDTWHSGRNNGNETAEIIVFYAGVVDEPITVKK